MTEDKRFNPDKLVRLFKELYSLADGIGTEKKVGVKCWEFLNCPAEIMRLCEAVIQNAERRCWLVVGTLSGQKEVAPCVKAFGTCKQCEFYKAVKGLSDEKADKVRIMVVEDEGIVALEIQTRLQRLGYAVCAVVSTGEMAIKEAKDKHPDLVLMDIRLKGDMDGIEAAQAIQKEGRVPVIYLTANSDDNTLLRAKLTEPFGFILKPFHERDLRSGIEMALYKHKVSVSTSRQMKSDAITKNKSAEELNKENVRLVNEILETTRQALSETSTELQKEYLKKINRYAEMLNAQLRKRTS
ncbi:MAG: response regulator [Candidatus Magnetobacterium sp. LHC-1]